MVEMGRSSAAPTDTARENEQMANEVFGRESRLVLKVGSPSFPLKLLTL